MAIQCDCLLNITAEKSDRHAQLFFASHQAMMNTYDRGLSLVQGTTPARKEIVDGRSINGTAAAKAVAGVTIKMQAIRRSESIMER